MNVPTVDEVLAECRWRDGDCRWTADGDRFLVPEPLLRQLLEGAYDPLSSHWTDSVKIPTAAEGVFRYSRSPLRPVHVSERMPGPEDCDLAGRCWWYEDNEYWQNWSLEYISNVNPVYWLPFDALPYLEIPPEVDEMSVPTLKKQALDVLRHLAKSRRPYEMSSEAIVILQQAVEALPES